MKLQSKKQKTITAVIIAAVVVALIVIGIVVVASISNSNSNTNQDPEKAEISEIRISSYPDKVVYYVGDEFDPKGTKITVITTDANTFMVDYTDPELTITGFDSTVVNNALPLTISYKGCTLTFNVQVKEVPSNKPYLVSIRVSENMKTTYTLKSWQYGLKLNGVKLICTLSDGSEQEVDMAMEYCEGVDYNVTSACTQVITIRYSHEGIWAETTVTITITE